MSAFGSAIAWGAEGSDNLSLLEADEALDSSAPEGFDADAAVDHEFEVEQALAGLALLLGLRWRRAKGEVTAAIVEAAGVSGLDTRNPPGGPGGSIPRIDYAPLTGSLSPEADRRLKDLRAAVGRAMAPVLSGMQGELAGLVALEAEHWREVFGMPGLTGDDANRIVTRLRVLGVTLKDRLEGLDRSAQDRIVSAVADALASGGGVAEALERVYGRGATRGVDDAILTAIDREARTVGGAVVNATRGRMAEKALGVPRSPVDRCVHVSVLDSRTSALCVSLSGRVYRLPEETPNVPPLHPNCRSRLWYLRRNQRTPEIPSGVRWLRRQPRERQEEILGVRIARLWRGNRITLTKLITPSLRPLTLAEVRERMEARRRAGR